MKISVSVGHGRRAIMSRSERSNSVVNEIKKLVTKVAVMKAALKGMLNIKIGNIVEETKETNIVIISYDK